MIKNKQIVADALKEDIKSGDISALLIPSNAVCNANIISNESMLVCGIDWVNLVFQMVNPTIQICWFFKDGDWAKSSDILCEISGNTRSILTAERTALNFLQTLSGTATITAKYTKQLQNLILLDTRKTIPGLRLPQKYATKIGGAQNHRLGLYDAYLIKENHIMACGGINKAVALAKHLSPTQKIEVEVENLIEYQEALDSGCEQILLDNFTLNDIKTAVKIRQDCPQKYSAIKLEISGNINLANIKKYDATNADFISVGAITKHIKAIDLSLKLNK